MGKCNTVIAPSGYARSSDFRIRQNKLIRRPLEFFALQKIGVTICYILISNVSMTSTVSAECIPTPDCVSIGYTETSCDGKFVRCPFDTSKLFCVPCDNDYKYTCTGDNIVSGVGSACNGKYLSCECYGGGTFNNGKCQLNCTVGMIYYSDKSCSSIYDSSKTPIGIVVKDNELVMSQRASSTMYWSNSYVDTSLTNYSSSTDAKTDYNGKSNTITIITEDSDNIVAQYCNTYTTVGTRAGDWYLPAAGELYSYVYSNYSTINTTIKNLGWTFGSYSFRSSSEYSLDGAWLVYHVDGSMYNSRKDSGHSVACFLAIN